MFAFAVVSLAVLSVSAFAYAVRLALSMRADSIAKADRIERATRPVHGVGLYVAPRPVRNRLGED